jgi:hypothetical protein
MAPITAGFNTGQDGRNISTSDPGNANAWDIVNLGTGATATYDSVQSITGLSGKLFALTNGQQAQLIWSSSTLPQMTDYYGHFYARQDVAEGVDSDLFQAFNEAAANFGWRLTLVQATSKFRIEAASGETATSTNTIPSNQWFRIEYHAVHSGSVAVTLQIFLTANSITPDETLSLTPSTIRGYCDRQIYTAQGASRNTWFEDVITNALGFPGPILDPVAQAPHRGVAAAA